jgi:tRNA 5-methylaminomethyl-2-thiouridine biosynthesis bifunctional protein
MAGSGGLDPARHLFLHGCGLPAAWAGRAQWRILATGFGHGLNFLAAWHAWREDPHRPQLLHFVAIDASPVGADDLRRGAAGVPELQPLAEALAAQWKGLVAGFHRFAFEEGRVLLTLCVGEVAPMLREQAFRADAVFLDGLAPAIHELKAVTRLCHRGSALAGSTHAAQARQDLQACGWQLAPGEGLSGRFEPAWKVKGLVEEVPVQASEAVVIGAGLAGAAVAASLARRGWQVRVLDAAAEPAAGASALPIGLLAPHQTPDDNLLTRLSRAGVRITLGEAQQRLAAGLEWEQGGVLESRGNDPRPVPALGEELDVWSRAATPGERQRAGLAPGQHAWWHAQAAWIEPRALVRAWLRRPGVRFQAGARVQRIVAAGGGQWRIEDPAGALVAQAPLVVVAAALGSAALLADRIQLHAVRGQVTWAPHGEDAAALPPFAVNGEGHFLPRVPLLERGAWMTGSTYGRADADASVRGEDTAANLQRARQLVPAAAPAIDSAAARGELRAWAGVRCASSDRRPLVGEVAPGLWVSTAMGSRGLTFAALCAELLAARFHAEPLPVEARLAEALDLARQPGFRPA